jgi:hypothetical protein
MRIPTRPAVPKPGIKGNQDEPLSILYAPLLEGDTNTTANGLVIGFRYKANRFGVEVLSP